MQTILDLVGNTPLVNLKNVNPNPRVKVYAKLEGNNPGGSVKDRAAYWMIKGARDRGDLKPGIRLIEPTSGNRSEEHTSELQSLMRISYAVFCLKKKKNKTETKATQNKGKE